MKSEAIRAIDVALDLGVNWIDTAPFYGWGRAEQIVGKALQGKRDRVYIFTKCGTLPNEQGGVEGRPHTREHPARNRSQFAPFAKRLHRSLPVSRP